MTGMMGGLSRTIWCFGSSASLLIPSELAADTLRHHELGGVRPNILGVSERGAVDLMLSNHISIPPSSIAVSDFDTGLSSLALRPKASGLTHALIIQGRIRGFSPKNEEPQASFSCQTVQNTTTDVG